MDHLATDLEAIAADTDFSGVVRVDVAGETVVELARGDADRANARPITPATRFGTASGTKTFTALTVLSLIEGGAFGLDTPVRELVADRLPNIDPAVTVDHLLTHRSGIGDYLDEDELDDVDAHILGERSAHRFVEPSDYLGLLAVPPQRETPGEGFRYNNSGYMVLSLIVELTAGTFARTVEERVFEPAGMSRSGFFRSDDLPADVATGYLTDGRSNVFHLPVVGGGDGGAYVCAADVIAFWRALSAGRIVGPAGVSLLFESVSVFDGARSYGRGVSLGDGGDHAWLEGHDAGVSFLSGVRRELEIEYVVLSNTSSGAWPIGRRIAEER